MPRKQKVYQGLLLRSTPVEGRERKKEEAELGRERTKPQKTPHLALQVLFFFLTSLLFIYLFRYINLFIKHIICKYIHASVMYIH